MCAGSSMVQQKLTPLLGMLYQQLQYCTMFYEKMVDRLIAHTSVTVYAEVGRATIKGTYFYRRSLFEPENWLFQSNDGC